MNLYSASSWNL